MVVLEAPQTAVVPHLPVNATVWQGTMAAVGPAIIAVQVCQQSILVVNLWMRPVCDDDIVCVSCLQGTIALETAVRIVVLVVPQV